MGGVDYVASLRKPRSRARAVSDGSRLDLQVMLLDVGPSSFEVVCGPSERDFDITQIAPVISNIRRACDLMPVSSSG